MYRQYVTEIESEIGIVKFEFTYKTETLFNNMVVTNLDSVIISVNNKIIEVPKKWLKQTPKTIIKKLCAMYKNKLT